ncbi:MAG TPA: DUF1127 domain-containing protein [Roseiarcus sp.]|nr:DUF1127 domain-containing protein [Roseiarcus sp.]
MTTATAPCHEASSLQRFARPSLFDKALALLWRAALWPAHVVATRRMLAQLASMSDYELRDVGLTRQDLVDLTARPLDEDPTPHLNRARISRARRF